jgi:hypothetical protein
VTAREVLDVRRSRSLEDGTQASVFERHVMPAKSAVEIPGVRFAFGSPADEETIGRLGRRRVDPLVWTVSFRVARLVRPGSFPAALGCHLGDDAPGRVSASGQPGDLLRRALFKNHQHAVSDGVVGFVVGEPLGTDRYLLALASRRDFAIVTPTCAARQLRDPGRWRRTRTASTIKG